MKFAANLSFLYQEYAFYERFEQAKQDGFHGVEFLFPYDYEVATIQAMSQDNQLPVVLFNVRPGDWDAGERGIAALPGREEEFKRSVDEALSWAERLGVKRLHLLAGLCASELDMDCCWSTYQSNLAWACEQVKGRDVCWLIEPINQRDMPGYLLSYQADARRVIDEIASPNLKLQMDFYHCQIMEGDLYHNFLKNRAYLGHIQIAGVPDRHEPNSDNEVAYPYLLNKINSFTQATNSLNDELWVGCEYRPKNSTRDGLQWFRKFTTNSRIC